MRFCLFLFRPLVWVFNGGAKILFGLFKIPLVR